MSAEDQLGGIDWERRGESRSKIKIRINRRTAGRPLAEAGYGLMADVKAACLGLLDHEVGGAQVAEHGNQHNPQHERSQSGCNEGKTTLRTVLFWFCNVRFHCFSSFFRASFICFR